VQAWYRKQGTNLGDQLINQQPMPEHFGAEDGTGTVIVGEHFFSIPRMVPSTESPEYVERLKERADDATLEGLRNLHAEEAPRLAEDTGATGQAVMATNNTAKFHGLQRRAMEADPAIQASVPILQAARNNQLLGEVFADCQTRTERAGMDDQANEWTQKACSWVELRLEPGYQATIQRTVTVTMEDTESQSTQFVNVALGESENFGGRLDDEFPDQVSILNSFEGFISPRSIRQHYTVTILQEPRRSNDWQFEARVTNNSNDGDTQVLLVFEYSWRGEPQYEFTVTCADGDCNTQGDEFCKALWTCQERAPVMVDGRLVPAEVVAQEPPLYPVDPGDDPDGSLAADALVCMRATLAIDCARIYAGNACWPSDPEHPDAGQTCIPVADDGTLPNSCHELEEDIDCHPAGQGCAENGYSEVSDWCYIKTKLFRCAQRVRIPDHDVVTVTECAQGQACLDGSCTAVSRRVDPRTSRSESAARMVLAQHIGSDYSIPDAQPRPSREERDAQERAEVRRFIEQAIQLNRAGTLALPKE